MAPHPGASRGAAASAAALGLLAALGGMGVLPDETRAQGWPGLIGMPTVALEVVMTRELPGLGLDTVEMRLERALADTRPAPALDRNSADRLQVAISVSPVSSSELRGFYLPFSGVYGIGTVRLAAIRPVRVGARQVPIPAIVWQAERQARGPWHGAGTEALALLDELIGEFLDDYRRPAAP
jgi:hypothetical protein